MIKKSLYLALPLVLGLIISGCGGSSSSKDSESPTVEAKIYTATFNAQSSGITYECGSQIGTLSDEGIFKFEEGRGCTFSDGTNIVKTVASSELAQGGSIDEVTADAASDLATLLIGKTYYSVQPKDSRIVKLIFDEIDQYGDYWVNALLDTDSASTTLTITNDILSVPLYGNDFVFVSENKEEGYLLFNNDRRMYLDKTKAEAFVAANK